MKIEKNNSRLNNDAVYKFLDNNVSIVDLNTGPTEFGERWSSVINKDRSYPSNKVMDYVLGYYYDKTKMRGL
tara:strand:- start:1224 stop:1439 length:216 start_codon:yes stop_codon:yes gene_type:complete